MAIILLVFTSCEVNTYAPSVGDAEKVRLSEMQLIQYSSAGMVVTDNFSLPLITSK